jgi:hypothetical protein
MNLRKLSVNCLQVSHHTKRKTARTRSGLEHTTCPPRLADYAPLRSWVPDKAAAAGVNAEVVVICFWSYLTTVLDTLLHCAKERGVPMETAVLVLRVVRSCHIITEHSELDRGSR